MQDVIDLGADLTLFLPRGATTDLVVSNAKTSRFLLKLPERALTRTQPRRAPRTVLERWLPRAAAVAGLSLVMLFFLLLSNLLARNRSDGAPATVSINVATAICRPTQKLGTALDFLSTPADAAVQATEQHKLVFLLHISGNFEDCGFT